MNKYAKTKLKRVSSCPCGKPRRLGQRNCIACHAKNMREWRKVNRMNDEQRMKDNCRSASNTYVKRGVIVKAPCVVCGSDESQMHHEDYSKPKEVIWLCRPHHLAYHRGEISLPHQAKMVA